MIACYARLDVAWLIRLAGLHEILVRLGWPKLSSLSQAA